MLILNSTAIIVVTPQGQATRSDHQMLFQSSSKNLGIF